MEFGTAWVCFGFCLRGFSYLGVFRILIGGGFFCKVVLSSEFRVGLGRGFFVGSVSL